MQRYLYLPRLKGRHTLEEAIIKGAGSKDFFGTAYAQAGDIFEGFKLGDANVQVDNTLLLIEPEAAKKYETSLLVALNSNAGDVGGITPPPTVAPGGLTPLQHPSLGAGAVPTTNPGKAKSFYGS